jgi:hypothetical protein
MTVFGAIMLRARRWAISLVNLRQPGTATPVGLPAAEIVLRRRQAPPVAARRKIPQRGGEVGGGMWRRRQRRAAAVPAVR